MKPILCQIVLSLCALTTYSAQADAYGRNGSRHSPMPYDICPSKFAGSMSTGTPSIVTLTRSGYGDEIAWSNSFLGNNYQGNGICSMNHDGSAYLLVEVNNGSIVTFEGTISAAGLLTGSFLGEGVTFNGNRLGGAPIPRPAYPGHGYPPHHSVDPCSSAYIGSMSTGKPSTISLTRVGRNQVVWSNSYEGKTYTGQGKCDADGDGSAYISVDVNNGQIVTFQGAISAYGQLSGSFVNQGVSFTGSRAR